MKIEISENLILLENIISDQGTVKKVCLKQILLLLIPAQQKKYLRLECIVVGVFVKPF